MNKHMMITVCAFALTMTFSMPVFNEAPASYAGDGSRLMAHNLALMPLFVGRQPSERFSVLDLKPEQLGLQDEVESGAEVTLTRLVQHALDKRFGNGTVAQEEVAGAYAAITDEDPYLTPRQQVEALAERLGVEYVVAGNVWRYKDRSGTALASVEPSSVAFRLHLIYVPAKRRIWVGDYDKTQKALSENIFQASDFIKQKGQWLKAEDLAEIGVNDLVGHIPL